MANSYKTPEVYLDEGPQFPSSEIRVATAIPAFIGYTEKSEKNEPGDLDFVPHTYYFIAGI